MQTPRIAGTPPPSPFEQHWNEFWQWAAGPFSPEFFAVLARAREFLVANFPIISAIFVVAFLLALAFHSLRKRQKRIQKIWKFITLFLLKRQMIVPMLYTLGKNENQLRPTQLQKLLEIRAELSDFAAKNQVKNRIAREFEISEIIFDYFSLLEKNKSFAKNPKFRVLVRDLEFIDQKLVELQPIYNLEVENWNALFRPIVKYALLALGMRKFERLSPIEK